MFKYGRCELGYISEEDCEFFVDMCMEMEPIQHGQLSLSHSTTSDGYYPPQAIFVVSKGFMWNGANIVYDTISIMKASMVHDGFYTLIAQGLLPRSTRRIADKLFRKIYLEDALEYIKFRNFKGYRKKRAMLARWARGKYIYWGVRLGGWASC